MTLQNSGTSISFSQIENEFGSGGVSNETRRLGKYRRDDPGFQNKNVGEMTNMPLDSGVPQSGQIKFSDFYGKELNVVISYDVNQNNPPSGSSKFDGNNEKTVVGGFRSASSVTSSQGTRVTLHVHSGVSIGSQEGNSTTSESRYRSALTTGNGWESNTELDINIAGVVCGGGGNGGDGSNSHNSEGGNGRNGNTAIGISYPVETITNNGFIRAGSGGGAGGGLGKEDSETENRRGGGGGGGGGAGIPAGIGGEALNRTDDPFSRGGDGAAATGPNVGGSGGNGGNQGNEAYGGGGGGGGSFVTGGAGGTRGGNGSGAEATNGAAGGTNGIGGEGGLGGFDERGERSGGGEGGAPGFAILRTNGATYTLVNNGDFRGDQANVSGDVSNQF